MQRTGKTVVRWVLIGMAAGIAAAAGAQDLGLVAARNQFPLDQLVLEPTPEGAGTVGRGRLRLSVSVDWSNTFVMSPEVEDWLRARQPGRRPLTLAETRAIEDAHPGADLYFIDGEVTRWNLRASYGLSDVLQVTLNTAVLARGGGFGDATIESFHDLLDIGNAHRERLPQNQFQVYFHTKDHTFYRRGAPSTTVLSDTGIGLKLRSRSRWHGWMAALSATVKVPTGDEDEFGGSGNWDSQVMGYASRPLGPGTLHLNLAYTFLGGMDAPVGLDVDNTITGIAGYEIWSPHHRVNWVLQVTLATSPYRDTTESALSDAAYLVLVGARLPVGSQGHLTFALTENVFNYDDSTDIALHVGFTHTFDVR